VLALEGAAWPTRPETTPGRRPGRQRARAKRARWPGEWREATGFRFYRLADDRIVQVLSGHPGQPDEVAAAALQQVKAAGVMPEAAVRLGVLADRARWIWKQAQALFPEAVELLDSSPCREHGHQVAALPSGAHPARPREWV
jgi:hypothetical protein